MGVGRRKLAPLWGLALALACTRHTGHAQDGSSQHSYEHHADLTPVPWGPGDPLSGVMTFLPLKAVPVVRARNPAHNGRVCSAWGDFHYKTFDGDVFRFPGLCNYVLSAHCGAAYEDFNVQLRRGRESNATTLSRVTMKLDGLVVELTKSSILVDGRPVRLPFSRSGVLIQRRGSHMRVVARLGLVFTWNQDDSLLLELDPKYANQTCGLCGDFNGRPAVGEFLTHNARLTPLEFGNLQKLDGPTEQCPDPAPAAPENCSASVGICEELLGGRLLAGCAALVDVGSYVDACRRDLCLCQHTDPLSCVCDTLAEYSRQCAHAGGLPPDWRGPDLCPQTCPDNMQYHECRSPCADTCSNLGHSRACEDHCAAGCFCPEGTVLDDIGQTGCVPVSQCACTYNGATYAPGAAYATDCSNCTCSGGRWSCREVPCPGTCSVLGGAHFSTFDERQYTVHGDCSYVLAKPCGSGSFTVLAELRPCGLTDSETCLRSVTLSLDGAHTVVVVTASGDVFVNQIYTQLPVSAANVTVFRPSTFFIVAQTGLGLQLEVQLVPLMQLFVRLDPELRGRTCGLCGNFNQNQADDFAALSGLVEGTGAAFANTWKTQAACPNVRNSFEDPCSLSVENEKYAQHWCSRLTDTHGPFARCHAAVSPGTYYSNCLFDTCNCERSEDCLCAALSAYVHACAAKGVLLRGWRDGVCATPTTTCPESMAYHYHVSTCQPTCRALSEGDVTCHMSFVPVDGCACPEGTFLDEAGKCVEAASCPCYHRGSVVPSGESVHDGGALCTCTRGALSCIGGPVLASVCTAPMVYFDCRNATPGAAGAGCQKSCHTLDMACYSPQCVPGCVCPDGLVADGEGGCVAEEDCPCVHNEASYPAGQTIRVGCNTCTCDRRLWRCTDEPCLATCTVYGDGHYLTFDGQRYSFNGDCEYTLVQDDCGSSGGAQEAFRVVTENVPCGTTGTTCSKAIKLFLGSYELKLSAGKVEVIGDGAGQEAPYSVRQMGVFLVVDTNVGLVLLWDRKTSISVQLSPELKGRVCGLCGNFDDNALNDFTTRSQSVAGNALEFGNSWKFSPNCPDALAPRDPCTANPHRKSWAQKQCSIINGATFAACHAHVEPAKYYEACVSDACACDSGGDCECFCTAVAAYAQACHHVGLCVAWRTPDVCPLFCDYYNPAGHCEWHYQPCGAPCMRTCRNPSGDCLHDARGLEGCYPTCPAEAPIFDEDKMQCVAKCPAPPPPAPCRVQGKSYQPGAPVPSDRNCQSCVCGASGVRCSYNASACVCTYDGRRFRPGEVIYHTTDGTGGCLSAHCGANGTIQRSVHGCSPSSPPPPTTFSFSTAPRDVSSRPTPSPGLSTAHAGPPSRAQSTAAGTPPRTAPSSASVPARRGCGEECLWSPWLDVSRPGRGIDSGDFDTLENLRAHGHRVCLAPREVQCRAEDAPEVPLHVLGQRVDCSPALGLTCHNKDQASGLCDNYQIRVLCCTPLACPTSHGPSQTTPPAPSRTAETQASGSPAPGSTAGPATVSTAATAWTTVSTTPAPGTSTAVLTTSLTPGPIASTPPVSPPATSGATGEPPSPRPTGGCQREVCSWTAWIDGSYPSPEPNGGDFDTFQNLRAKGYKFCDRPRRVQCRAQGFPDTPLAELGQDVTCNAREGLLCLNRNQLPPICYNYEIRIQCCHLQDVCLPGTMAPATLATTPPTPPEARTETHSTATTAVPSTLIQHTVVSSAAVATPARTRHSTHAVTVPETRHCQPRCAWTKWFDVDYPSPGPHGGDVETYNHIISRGESICHRPGDISKLECRAENHPDVGLEALGQVVQCSRDVGLLCRNRDQVGAQKLCLNYQVRVLCCQTPDGCPLTTIPVTVLSTLSENVTSPTQSTLSGQRTSTTSEETASTTSSPQSSTSSGPMATGTSAPTASTTSGPITRATSASTATSPSTATASSPQTSTTSSLTASTTSGPITKVTSASTASTISRHKLKTTLAPIISTASSPQTSTTSSLTASTTSGPIASATSGPPASTTSGPITRATSASTASTISRHKLKTTLGTITSTTSSPQTSATSGPTASTTSSPIASATSGPTASTTSGPITRITSASTASTTSRHKLETTLGPITSTASSPQTSATSGPTASTTSGPTASTTSGPITRTTSASTASTTSRHKLKTTLGSITSTASSPQTSATSGPIASTTSSLIASATSGPTASTTSGPITRTTSASTASTTPRHKLKTTLGPITSTASSPQTSTTSSPIARATSGPTASTTSGSIARTTSSPETSMTSGLTASTTSLPQTSTTSGPTINTITGPPASTTSGPITKVTSASTASTISRHKLKTTLGPITSTVSSPQTSATSGPTASTTSGPTPSTTSGPITRTTSASTASTISRQKLKTTLGPITSTTSSPQTSTISGPTTSITSAPIPRATSGPTASGSSGPITKAISGRTASTISGHITSAFSGPTASTTSHATPSGTSGPTATTISGPITKETSASTPSTTSRHKLKTTLGPITSTTSSLQTSTTSGLTASTTSGPTARATSGPTASTISRHKLKTTLGPITSTTSSPQTITTSSLTVSTTSGPITKATSGPTIRTTSGPIASATSGPTASTKSGPITRTTSASTASTISRHELKTTLGPITSTTSSQQSSTISGPTASTTSGPITRATSGATASTNSGPIPRATSGPIPSGTSGPVPRVISSPTASTTFGPITRATSGPIPSGTSGPIASTTSGPITRAISGPTASTTSGPITRATSGPIPSSTSGPIASTSSGPITRATSGPTASTTSGPITRATTGPIPSGTSGPITRATSGPIPSSTSGPIASTSSGPITRATSGPTASTTSGPIIRATSGPIPSSTSGPTASTSSGPITRATSGPIASSSSGPITRATSGPILSSTSGSIASTTSGPTTRATSGPIPNGTSGPIASSSSGPITRATSGPILSSTSGPIASTTSGPIPSGTSGPTATPTSGPITRATSGPIPSSTSGPIASTSSVPITRATSGRIASSSSGPITRATSGPILSSTSGSTASTTSGPITRATSGPIPSSTSGPIASTSSGPITRATSGPTRRATSGPTGTTTSGPITRATSGPIPSSTSGPIVSTSFVPITRATSGPIASSSSGPITRATSGPILSSTSGPIASTSSGPIDSTISGPITRATSGPIPSGTPGPIASTSSGPITRATSGSTASTTSGPIASGTSGPITTTTSGPIPSGTSSPITKVTSGPTASTKSQHKLKTTWGPITSTTSSPQTSTTSGLTVSTTSGSTASTTSGPTASTTSSPITRATSASTASTISRHKLKTTLGPISSTTSSPQTSATSGPTASTTSSPIASATSGPITSTSSGPITRATSGPITTPSPVPTTSTPSAPLTSTVHVPTPGTTVLPPVTRDCQPRCAWTKWFDVDYPSPGPHGGDVETYNHIISRGESICHRPGDISKLECRAENHPDVGLEALGQVVQCSRDVGLLCRNRDQAGAQKLCLNYQVRVLCCQTPDGCALGPVTPHTTPPGETSPAVLSSSAVSSSAVSSSVPPSSPTCFCSVGDRLYPAGSVIYRQADLAGHCYYALCNRDCQVVRGVDSACPSTTAPLSPVTSPSTATSEPVPAQGCPHAVPPRKKGETWAMPNCSQATCEGGNVISLRPRPCPRVEKPTCANGYPALKVADQDGCCQHYQCQCVCSGWGDPHYITFDGTYYTFLDNCTYVLVQQIVPVYGHFRVLIDNYFCGAEDGLSCPKSLIVEYGRDRVVLTRRPVGGVMTNEVIFDNEVVSPGFRKNGIAVSRVGIKMYVTIPAIGVQVMFSGLIFSVEVPFSKFANNTEGQCGTCTNDQKDDCRLPGGAVATSCSKMSGLWNVTNPDQPSCHGPRRAPTTMGPTPPPATCPPSPLCQLILSKVFELCHAVIPPWSFYEGCVFDQCHVTDPEVVCSGLELYASLCATYGVCIDWRGRTNHTCPLACPAGKVYQPCGPADPTYCYGNDSASPAVLQDVGAITEGCFCPQGMTLFSASTQACVPAGCPRCLGPRGEPMEPGQTVTVDCQECSCEGAAWTVTCRTKPCPLPPACPLPGLVPVPVAPRAGQCCPQYRCACNASHCPRPVECPQGSHPALSYEEGTCCPTQNCSWTVCSVNGTLYQPGAVVSSTLCETCRCEVAGGRQADTPVVTCETQICDTHCPTGFEYQARSGQCCGTCVQVACVANSSGSPAHLFYPGETWSDPGNHCVTHECERSQDGLVVVTTRKACPPLSCALDQAQLGEDGCCHFCPQPRSTCAVHHKQQLIRQRDCSSAEPVRLAYCQGDCGDTGSLYSLEAQALRHSCRCCQELRTSLRNVTLHCADGSRRAFHYTAVEECGCAGQRCPSPGDASHAGESEPEGSEEEHSRETGGRSR